MRSLAVPAAIVALLALAACGGSDEEAAPRPAELVVRIGGPALASFGETVVLDGRGSRGEGKLEYVWTIVGPAADAAIPEPRNRPELTLVPDLVGDWVATLEVRDALGRTGTDSLSLRVGSTPIADPGPDQIVRVGDRVQLDGSASRDPAGLPLTYRWIVERQPMPASPDPEGTPPPLPDAEEPEAPPPLEVEGEDSAVASFVAERPGYYEFTLVVNNGLTRSRSRQVAIAALE